MPDQVDNKDELKAEIKTLSATMLKRDFMDFRNRINHPRGVPDAIHALLLLLNKPIAGYKCVGLCSKDEGYNKDEWKELGKVLTENHSMLTDFVDSGALDNVQKDNLNILEKDYIGKDWFEEESMKKKALYCGRAVKLVNLVVAYHKC